MNISSRCQVSPGRGRRLRSRLAKSAPNFVHQSRMLSWGHHDPALGEDQFDVAQAEAEHVIQPN
jgi:hypothetical protein